jgi:hypothetical protein
VQVALAFQTGLKRPNLNSRATLEEGPVLGDPEANFRATSFSVGARPSLCASSLVASSTTLAQRRTRRVKESALLSSSRIAQRIFEIAYDSNLVRRSGS